MANISQKDMGPARLYASSMLELAQAKGEADSLLEELLALDGYLAGNAEFEGFLASVMVDPVVREKSIERIFRKRASDLLVDTLQVLNRRDRLGLIRAIIEAYRLAHEELRGRIDVHVRTAVPLSDDSRGRIREAASRYAGKEAQLVERVDESLIGGMVVNIGDEKFDTSVATRLKSLRGALLERASHEIHSGKHALKDEGK